MEISALLVACSLVSVAFRNLAEAKIEGRKKSKTNYALLWQHESISVITINLVRRFAVFHQLFVVGTFLTIHNWSEGKNASDFPQSAIHERSRSYRLRITSNTFVCLK